MHVRPRPAHGVALLFLANGLSLPSLWPRLPEIRDAVGASSTAFGLALLGTGLGGIAGSLLAPRVARWLSLETAAIASAVAVALAAVTVGFAGTVPALFLAFVVAGSADGVADIEQNALLFDVQRTGDRSLVSRMHAVWSVGALGGTGLGTLAAAAGIGVLVQVVALAVVGTALALLARGPIARLSDAPAGTLRVVVPETRATSVAVPDGRVTVAPRTAYRLLRTWALVATTGAVVAAVEAIANEWSALTLRDGLGASVAVAGLGPTVYAGAMLVGRLLGDRAIDRWGGAGVARAGAGAVVVGGGLGLALATWLDLPAALIAGLVVAGIGTATLFPLMLAAGDALDPSGRGVAAASLGARGGFLAVPVIVGSLGDHTSMVAAFALLPVAGLLVAITLPRGLRRS